MINNKWKIQRAYTLIEILVGITIIALLFSLGYINFRDFSRRQAIGGAGKLLLGDLRLAQQQALSGQKPGDVNCADPNTLTGYFFDINAGASKYTIYAGCSGGVSSLISKEVGMPAGIAVIAPSPNPILFKILGAGTNLDAGSTATIKLTQDQTNNAFCVGVGAGGEVQEEPCP